MEDFIDYLLWLLLIFFILFTGLLLFFLVKNSTMAYILSVIFLAGLVGIGGVVIWKVSQRKRLGDYYTDLQELLCIKKEIHQSIKHLDKPVKKVLITELSQLNQLYRETRRSLQKIAEIDKDIAMFERKHPSRPRQSHLDATMKESTTRYQENLSAIKFSKNQNLRQVQHVLQVLHDLNSQIVAMKYSQEKPELNTELVENITAMLHEIRSLNRKP